MLAVAWWLALVWLQIGTAFVQLRGNHWYLPHVSRDGLSIRSDGGHFHQDSQGVRSDVPSRYDTCLVFATGYIGVEPKEMYLKNGHYVVSFPVSQTSYFYWKLALSLSSYLQVLMLNRLLWWVILLLRTTGSARSHVRQCGSRARSGTMLQRQAKN